MGEYDIATVVIEAKSILLIVQYNYSSNRGKINNPHSPV
jgi:hypothetical protein